jgi:hypothetical protein
MDAKDMTTSDSPLPPVPQSLRELLRKHPQHIERLQEVLAEYAQKQFRLMSFDGAVSAIEGRLETFVSEAHAEVRAAKTSGDVRAIERANEKASLMRRVHFKACWIDDEGLWNHFQATKQISE